MKFLYLSLIVLSVMFIVSTNAYALHPLPIPVLSMKSNTIGHIYVKFSTYYHNQTIQLGPMDIYDANLTNHIPLNLTDLSVIPNRTSIMLDSNDTIVDYTVTAKKNLKGIYALPIEHLSDLSPYVVGGNPLRTYQEKHSKSYCHMIPLVIGLNSSQIKEETLDKFVFLNASDNCPVSLTDQIFVGSKVIDRLPETFPSTTKPITADLDKETYFPGDSVIIRGHTYTNDTKVTVELEKDHKLIVKSTDVSITQNGTFISNFTIPRDSAKTWSVVIVSSNGGTLTLYLNFESSPLKQFKSGVAAKDVQCNDSFSLVMKAEDGTPACVKPDTAQKLIERGWGESLQSLPTSPLKMEIIGLNQTYETSRTIIVTVQYTGYEQGGVYPDVKILDANGTQIWSNCCIAHNETPSMHFGTFTYDVEGLSGYPVINKTGTYTMVVSLDNVTTDAIFDVIPSVKIQANSMANLKNDTGVITLNNQTYYFETPSYTSDAYSHPVQVSFHDVVFTLFPSGFRGGLPSSCGSMYYWTDAEFSDYTSELLHIFAGPKCPVPPLPTYFSNHTNPQAGLTFYGGKMKLLVSASITNSSGSYLPASFIPCDTHYSQNYTGMPALYMPANSTGKLCVRYHNLNDSPVRIGIRISEANLTNDSTDITTWNDSGNNTIPKGNSTVVYWIETGDHRGLYGLTVFCVPMPLAVGYDNTTLTQSDFPWLAQSTWYCPMESYDFHIDSTTGIKVKYIPVK